MSTQSTVRDPGGPLAAVLARVPEAGEIAPGTAEALSRFLQQYYTWVPPEDLGARDPEDLYGAALAHWQLGAERAPGEVKLAIYNPDPDPERDGWASPHTALDLVTDDMPFLVDSVEMEITRLGYDAHLVIHPMIRLQRDDAHRITAVLDPNAEDGHRESFIHVELDREDEHGRLVILTEAIQRVLSDVRSAVTDWYAMAERARALAEELLERDPESAEFLRWLAGDHFTFLGYREYELTRGGDGVPCRLAAVPGSGLGILAGEPRPAGRELSPRATELALDPTPLLLTKANSRATVHRPAPLDYVGVKRFDAAGNVVGERRFLGLYTSTAYRERADRIPLIRGKVAGVLERAGFPPDSHDAKALAEICESQRRDTLFQISTEELLETAVGILGLGERQQVRVFLRADPLERFVNATVCLPRDRYNRDTRQRIGQILLEHFGGSGFDYNVQVGESRVATVNMVIHTPQGIGGAMDSEELQDRVAEAIRPWSQDLRERLIAGHEERHGRRLARRYETAFPPAYQAMFEAGAAIDDIDAMERVHDAGNGDPRILLYRPAGTSGEDHLRAKLMSPEPVSLSRVLDVFAHLGAQVSDEEPYEIRPAGRPPMWLYDFGLEAAVSDLSRAGSHFASVFVGVWRGELENDYLGELVIAAGLGAREITVLRAVFKYLRQVGIPFSDRYVERTLVTNPRAATLLVELFEDRHDPSVHRSAAEASAAELRERLAEEIDAVASLDEDRILRAFTNVIDAVLRTNYYQRGPDNKPKEYLSFKLDSQAIHLLPHPRPRFEIFVYSPRVEGVHLRGGSVARGGLRWSDRREDFRTEILGLMKAQMVKNALIVPVGSKGGFIVKRPPSDPSREAQLQEGIACYRTFLCGLLDLTDNIVDSSVVAPADVVRYDGDDPYLVVAADKGTASFSDIANAVSADYGFWLGDAFASGGSVGYDHKAMGITARGAWESVKRHFRELGTDVQSSDFTVAGIGDMSGDVFGNGMLASRHIRLVAAFNHQHIFIDPDPDPETSFAERRRLFDLPRSAWSDYDAELISPGGGIFPRSAKQIPLSPQARKALGIEAAALTPAQLVSAILRAPVDLLFNGGIGTYVKATAESDHDAGDRANDAVRVNGCELRARVVGEGGNLGLTQAGRIEYARGGGRINTDAIDNVAGVNCSDHEVNIKILLDAAVRGGELDAAARNALLAEMTDGVAERVLRGSYLQTQALSLAVAQAPLLANTHARVIGELEEHAGLDRELERLPSDAEIAERVATGGGLVSPELAVVLAYTKIHLDACLLDSDLPEDPSLVGDLRRYFPDPLPERFAAEIDVHRLRREIIATTVANELVDRQGSTFVFRLTEQTGATPAHLARAYAVAREVHEMPAFWAAVESLDNRVDAGTQLSMLLEGRRLLERAVRWLVRFHPRIDVEALIARYRPGAELAAAADIASLDLEDRQVAEDRIARLSAAGVGAQLARRVAGMDQLAGIYGVVEVAERIQRPLALVLDTNRRLGSELSLSWLRRRVLELPRADRWQSLARDALRDDLDTLHRGLTGQLLSRADPTAQDAAELVAAWRESQGAGLTRYLSVLEDIRDSGSYDTTTLPVALRELRILVLR